MPEIIGCAEVEFVDADEPATTYDIVEILDNGGLRVSQVWQGEHRHGWCEVETTATYLPPGSWKQVRPRQLAGTLFVEDEEADPTASPAVAGGPVPLPRLGTRVIASEAQRLAANYLIQKYKLSQPQAEHEVRQKFATRGEIEVAVPEHALGAGEKRIVRFLFINTAPDVS